MDAIENLKKLGEKENFKYLFLVIWLVIGVSISQINAMIGNQNILSWISIGIFLPFLTFLMFLFLLSLIAKKDIKEIKAWKVLLIFFASLWIMLVISILLIFVFIVSIISYIFFTSWFYLYGSYRTSIRFDNNLKRRKYKNFYRITVFITGVCSSIALLLLYFINSELLGTLVNATITEISGYVVIFVGIILLVLTIITIIYSFKKYFNAWLGLFSLLMVIYASFLILQIFLALRSTNGSESSSFVVKIALLVADLGILLYTISTLMGSQAEILFKNLKLKRLGIDTILIWLVFSKVAYEFVRNFPYPLLTRLQPFIPWIDLLTSLDASSINLLKNVLVLLFFLIILSILGFYMIRKNVKLQGVIQQNVKKENEILVKEEIEELYFAEIEENREES